MLVYCYLCAFIVAALLYTRFIREVFCLVFLHTGSSVAAQSGAGAFAGADANVQMSHREKCLFSHFASAPPWHLQVSIFKAHFSLYGSPGQICLSLLGVPTKGTRDLFCRQDAHSAQPPVCPLQS